MSLIRGIGFDIKKFNFEKFLTTQSDVDTRKSKKRKSTISSFADDDNSEIELDPIRTDTSDSLFHSEDIEDAIVSGNNNNNE